jgi:hypothetical protein
MIELTEGQRQEREKNITIALTEEQSEQLILLAISDQKGWAAMLAWENAMEDYHAKHPNVQDPWQDPELPNSEEVLLFAKRIHSQAFSKDLFAYTSSSVFMDLRFGARRALGLKT